MTYGELKVLIQQYIEGYEQSFEENLPLFVRLAEEEICRKVQLPDLKVLATASLTPNDRFLTTPGDFLSSYSIGVLDGGEFHMLINKDLSFLREAFPSPSYTGRPRYYAQYNDTAFMLAPTPDAAYEVELNYFFVPESLSAGDDDTKQTWISTKAENALLFGTILHGYIYLKGDGDVIAMYQEKFTSALADLKIIAEGRNRKDSYRQADKRLPV